MRRLTFVTRRVDVAEDLAQEAFLRLAQEIDAGRSPDDPGAWLRRVGTNLAMSRGRHLQVVDRREGELPRPAEPASPEDLVVKDELTAAVGVVFAQMSPVEQRALALAAHGFAGCEIAVSLGRTPAATRTLLCRARAKIRERMFVTGLAAG